MAGCGAKWWCDCEAAGYARARAGTVQFLGHGSDGAGVAETVQHVGSVAAYASVCGAHVPSSGKLWVHQH